MSEPARVTDTGLDLIASLAEQGDEFGPDMVLILLSECRRARAELEQARAELGTAREGAKLAVAVANRAAEADAAEKQVAELRQMLRHVHIPEGFIACGLPMCRICAILRASEREAGK